MSETNNERLMRLERMTYQLAMNLPVSQNDMKELRKCLFPEVEEVVLYEYPVSKLPSNPCPGLIISFNGSHSKDDIPDGGIGQYKLMTRIGDIVKLKKIKLKRKNDA